jgi:hypothetical protein
MPRGGARSGSQGTAYTNRSDLNTNRTLPATAVPGQPYGAAGAQLASQSAVPMGSPALPTAQPVSDMASQAPPSPAMGGEAPMGPGPGELGDFHGPSMNPNEDVTHGLGVGPGAGPEALAPSSALLRGLSMLNILGDNLPANLKAVRDSLNATQVNRGPSQ